MVEEQYCLKEVSDVLKELNTTQDGLSTQEAQNRITLYGRNEIARREKRPILDIIIAQVKSPLILILIFASLISYSMGDTNEALIILLIVFVNSIMGCVQEYKSEKALQELIKYVSYTAKVLRDGKLTPVDSREIAIGDVVFLEAGDMIPADLRLMKSEGLSINESTITGESHPVHKIIEIIKIANPMLHDMKNCGFMGTTVVSGRGMGVITAVADKTFFGKTAAYLKAEVPEADFQKNIRSFGDMLVKLILVGVVAIMLINTAMGRDFFDSILFSLALAVGIIPESLPVIITITLSRGALRMTKKGVIVKKLSSIEDLGNVDVICTDKTGTLTESKITLQSFIDLNWNESQRVLKYAFNSTSVVKRDHQASGNPIDLAIYEKAKHLKLTEEKKLFETPFDYESRMMSSAISENGKTVFITKGAPEAILEVCSKALISGQMVDLKSVKPQIEEKIKTFSNNGYRTIAVAFKEVKESRQYSKEDGKELILLGLLSFFDPPKKDAITAIKSFEKMGVKIKILTGDDPLVARKVAEEVGFANIQVIMGSEIDLISDQQLQERVESANLFARITPAHKFRIIAALKENGHIVGFIGDGVNDAPALREADVGISVSNGTDVSKDAASIILTRKSLHVLEEGIRGGREVFGNVTKYILNTISANVGNMTTLGITSVFLPFFPLLPSQILLTNLVSDAPLLTISTDKVDPEELRRPRRWSIKYIRDFALVFGSISVLFDLITVMILVFVLKASDVMFRTGWFLESVLSEIVVTFAIRTHRSFYKSRPSTMLLLTSIASIALTIGLIYSPIGKYFEFTPLPMWFLGVIALILMAYFTIVETLKKKFNRMYLPKKKTVVLSK